jgi:hypothetical protein
MPNMKGNGCAKREIIKITKELADTGKPECEIFHGGLG